MICPGVEIRSPQILNKNANQWAAIYYLNIFKFYSLLQAVEVY
jgi:hypothetical protein